MTTLTTELEVKHKTKIKNDMLLEKFIFQKDCFDILVPHEEETVRASFVMVTPDIAWRPHDKVDLVVSDPEDVQVHYSRDKVEDKFEFVARKSGEYKFCFNNKSPFTEKIDFDVHVGGHKHAAHEELAKDDHFYPLSQQIERVSDSLMNVYFEQHWLEAHAERQAILNKGMSKRVIFKAFMEVMAIMCVSLLQVYYLRRLFLATRNTRMV